MEKVKLALNYALMIEMIKAKTYSPREVILFLEEGNETALESLGEGIPTWKTLVEFYQNNKEKCQRAIEEGYEITFLTKGALKSLLTIKFQMKEGEDFVDTGEFLNEVIINRENLQALKEVISKNWTIILTEENITEDFYMLRIELTHKPLFNF